MYRQKIYVLFWLDFKNKVLIFSRVNLQMYISFVLGDI